MRLVVAIALLVASGVALVSAYATAVTATG
jgi:hypothetical protein